MTHNDRDEVADAIRARQSLQNDAQPAGEDFSAQGFTSGEQFGAEDDPLSGDEVALDDDDVELSGDDD